MLKKIPKRIKTILLCGILACGAIAGAAIGIMMYQIVKEVEDRIKSAFKFTNILGKLPFKKKR